MNGIAVVFVVALCASLGPHTALAAPSLADTLAFEVPEADSGFAGWGGGPRGTIARDSTTLHGGRYSARIERGATSLGSFTSVSGFRWGGLAGRTIELRGWLKTDGVEEWAGLWLREDSGGGVLQFDNMQSRGLRGTTPWTEYRVSLPYDAKTTKIAFGALLAGKGTIHADDLALFVDDVPIDQAPLLVRKPTAIDRDHEFDGGSKVVTGPLTPAQVENLALLARVWGFVKYHHPKVTTAALHWDYELFRVMPNVLAAKSRAEAAKAIVAWLDRVGEPPPCQPCATLPDSAALRPRIEWIHDRRLLGRDLSERLERIYQNRPTAGEQHYVSLAQWVGNPEFGGEAAYATPALPDPGYRLLALFRFWNMVEYWFPYRDLIREDWNAVLAEFVPPVAAATTELDYRLTMLALVARIHDGHANVWNMLDVRPPRGDSQLPVVLRKIEGKFVVTAYSDSARGAASGLQVGDAIVRLDGLSADSLAEASAKYVGASNAAARDRELARTLTRGPAGPCRVTIEREGVRQELTASRAAVDAMAGLTHDLPGPAFRLLAPDVAYLKLSSVTTDGVPGYVRGAAGTRCLVIDIRNYPSAFMPFTLGSHLVGGTTAFTRFTHGDLANPGAFFYTEPLTIAPDTLHYAGRVVILVDESSQSQAEYTAMALRAAPGALVVGSTTAGADGNVSAIMLPGGLRAMFSGIGVFYPDKRPTQQVGILPDLVVTPTIAGIRAGRDEVLEAALEHVLGREVAVPLR